MNLKEFKEAVKPSKNLLILDGDWLVFKAMSAVETETEWEDDVWTYECNHKNARDVLNDDILALTTRRREWSKNTEIVFAFSSGSNWRKELVDPEYKANRKAVRKPSGYKTFVKDFCDNSGYLTVMEDSLEADDVIGIIASNPREFNTGKATIISCDKDFRTIPNCDFYWVTDGNIYPQTVESANFWHLYQTMKGDLTDGYSGIKGWGDKSEDFLENPYYLRRVEHTIQSGKNKGNIQIRWEKETIHNKTTWECILSVAAKVDMTEEDVIHQARLARILRYDDYDIDTQQITLWKP